MSIRTRQLRIDARQQHFATAQQIWNAYLKKRLSRVKRDEYLAQLRSKLK